MDKLAIFVLKEDATVKEEKDEEAETKKLAWLLGLLVTMLVVLSGSAGATANAPDISHPKLGMNGR